MAFEGAKAITIPRLGGLMTYLRPLDVPAGFSPFLQNVRFVPRAVLSRPGLTPFVSYPSGFSQPARGLAQYFAPDGSSFLVALDSAGQFWVYSVSAGTWTGLGTVARAGAVMNTVLAFNRAWATFYSGPQIAPQGPARFWDGRFGLTPPPSPPAPSGLTQVDLTSQVENNREFWVYMVRSGITPGAHQVALVYESSSGVLSAPGPTASVTTTASGVAGIQFNLPSPPSGVAAVWVAYTPAGSSQLYMNPIYRYAVLPGQTVTAVLALPDDTLAASGFPAPSSVTVPPLPLVAPHGPMWPPFAREAADTGEIARGVHQIAVAFETVWGFLTAPSQVGSWYAGGGRSVLVDSIPIGPWYVAARRLYFTPAGLADFYYLPQFRIPDNTTTEAIFSFDDGTLSAGELVNDQWNTLAGAGEVGGMALYSGRMAYFGRAAQVNFPGMGFDGGWTMTRLFFDEFETPIQVGSLLPPPPPPPDPSLPDPGATGSGALSGAGHPIIRQFLDDINADINGQPGDVGPAYLLGPRGRLLRGPGLV